MMRVRLISSPGGEGGGRGEEVEVEEEEEKDNNRQCNHTGLPSNSNYNRYFIVDNKTFHSNLNN